MRAVVRVSDGKAVQVMRHGPWGELELDSVASGFARLPFGFAGGIHDDATKLVRFGAREYDARTGRWLSKDEARFGGGENFYEYAGGDPVNSVDLDGRKPSVARQALCLLLFHGYPALYTLCIGGDDGEDRDRAAGGAAGGNLPGNGGGERDDGICTLERDLREIPSCEPDKVTRYCQYYCPATGRKKTLVLPPPYSDQPCQTTIFGQSR
jgi:RHS repeat-associated protein